MPDMSRLYDAILNGEDKLALQLVQEALQESANPTELISRWMIPAMDEVGRRFEAQEYFIPEILLAARAMKTAMEPLRPLLAARGAQPTGRVVLGTVKGDLHDIGKNMVGSMLEGAGFEVIGSWNRCAGGEVRRSGRERQREHPRAFGSSHGHAAGNEKNHRGAQPAQAFAIG